MSRELADPGTGCFDEVAVIVYGTHSLSVSCFASSGCLFLLSEILSKLTHSEPS